MQSLLKKTLALLLSLALLLCMTPLVLAEEALQETWEAPDEEAPAPALFQEEEEYGDEFVEPEATGASWQPPADPAAALFSSWEEYKEAVDYISGQDPYTQIQLDRYDESFTRKITGICNISSVTTLLNRRLALEGRSGELFTAEEALRANGCTDIRSQGTRYYYVGDTDPWYRQRYTNSSGTSYQARVITSTAAYRAAADAAAFNAYLASLLMEHPEGICIRNSQANHVVVIYYYEQVNGAYRFYVKDPVNNYSGPFEGSYMYGRCGGDLYSNLSAICYLEGSVKPELPTKAELISRSITTKGNLGFNFYVYLPEAMLADPGARAELCLGEESIPLPLSQQESAMLMGKSCRKLQVSIAARQVNDPVTLRLYDGQGEPIRLSFQGTDYTASGYSMSTQEILELYELAYADSDAALVALVRALSDYCSCAQAQFDYNVENRAEVHADLSAVTLETLAPYARIVTEAEGSPVHYVNSSLSLKSETVIKHYFTLSAGSIEDYRVSVAGAGEDRTRLYLADSMSRRYCLEILNVEARNLDNPFTVEICEKDGAEPLLSISYSALSYAHRVLEAGNQAQSLENVAKALYLYSTAAKFYFG